MTFSLTHDKLEIRGRAPIKELTEMKFFAATVKVDDSAAVIPRAYTMRAVMNRCSKKGLSAVGGVVIVSLALNACGIAPLTPVKQKHDSVVDLSGKIHSLQRQLRERDKRITELETQLEGLKLIDQDHERQKQLLAPPGMRMPIQ